MKLRRVLSTLFVPAALMVLAIRCNNDEGITYSVNDVSSRITGFSNGKTGAGAELTVTGSQLQNVQRLFIGNQVVRAINFTNKTESNITFTVPTAVGLGVNNVLLVFPGSERAYAQIEVVPFQAISSFAPYSAATGEIVTLLGVNLDIVTGVKLGDVDATIQSQSFGVLKFVMPSGAPTGKITLIGPGGSSRSTSDLISCAATPATSDCPPGLNPNDGFELGSGDNFDSWEKWNGGTLMTATTTPGEVFRGTRALKVTRDGKLGSGQWRIQLTGAAVNTDIGASYTVYLWAKATAAGGAMRVSTTPSPLYTADQDVPTTWTRLAFTFTANQASTRVVLDMNGKETAATNFFIDDVKLIKN